MREMREICAACPRRQVCESYSLEHDVRGIWAGLTWPQRKTIRSQWGITARPLIDKATEMHIRRRRVASLWEAGVSLDDSATALGVSVNVIIQDRTWLNAQKPAADRDGV